MRETTKASFDFYTALFEHLTSSDKKDDRQMFATFNQTHKLDYTEFFLLFSLKYNRGCFADQPVMKTLILCLLICFKDELDDPDIYQLIRKWLSLVPELEGKHGFNIGEIFVFLSEEQIKIDVAELQKEKLKLINNRESRTASLYYKVYPTEPVKTW
jgi:hypothetical protein